MPTTSPELPTGTRVLVTGAGGFVGANLVRRLLDAGVDVVAIVRPGGSRWRLEGLPVDVREADLSSEDTTRLLVGDLRPDCILHLAAHGGYSWQTDLRSIVNANIVATAHLVAAASAHRTSAFVAAGSSSEYGARRHAPSENDLPEPSGVYAVAKLAATLLTADAARRTGLPAIVLRLYSVYGPWEEPGRLIPELLARGLAGDLPPLVSAHTARDFVYVSDVCDAFILAALAADSHRGAVYNVGSGRQTTLREIVDLHLRSTPLEVEPAWDTMDARPWDTDVWIADASRIERELGWHAKTSLEDGLRKTREWLVSNPEIGSRYGSELPG